MIDAIETALDLPPGELDLEREVLRDYGNMSAPTVLFVLDRLIDRGLPERVDDDRLRSRLHLRRTAARSARDLAAYRDPGLGHAAAAGRAAARASATPGDCSRGRRTKSAAAITR